MCNRITGKEVNTRNLNPSYVNSNLDTSFLFNSGQNMCPTGYFISHLSYYYNFAPDKITCTDN